MNIKSRLRKLESNSLVKTPCFCSKTLVDLWYGKPGADALTYCANCKGQFEFWANLSAEALKAENLTDLVDKT